MSPSQLAEWIYASSEWWTVAPFTELAPALHFSRSLFVRSLPPARRILDLGGTALGSDKGAMVLMGYPYAFDELVVVDLPPDDRNELYKESVARTVTQTELGPVHYHYHSMSDLARYEDGSFDLVYSGQSIEHVPVDEADRVLVEAARILRPGGYLALDTPNARVCRVQQPGFIDPDHDHDALVAGEDATVDELAQQQRVDHRDAGVERRRDQEDRQLDPVGTGVADNPPDRPGLELLLGDGRVHAEPARHHHAGTVCHSRHRSAPGERLPPAIRRGPLGGA